MSSAAGGGPAPRALLGPEQAQAARVQGLLARALPAQALPLARELAARAPNAPDAQLLLALSAASAGEPDLAEPAFRAALGLAPAHPLLLRNFAVFLQQQGRPEQALPLLQQLVAARPQEAGGWQQLGRALLGQGQAEQAAAALAKATSLEPGVAAHWVWLGNAERERGRLQPAHEAFATALRLEPGHGLAWLNLGATCRLLGRPEEALRCYERAAAQGAAGPELGHAACGALLDLGRTGEALATAEALVRQHPAFVPGQVSLAEMRWQHPAAGTASGSSAPDFLHDLARAAAQQPAHQELHLAWAGLLLAANRQAEALEVVQRLRQRADTPRARRSAADVLQAMRRREEAAALYASLVQEAGQQASAGLLNAAATNLLTLQAPAQAATLAQQALQQAPQDQEAWALLGTAWRLQGDARAAWLFDVERLVAYLPLEETAPDLPWTALQQRLQALHTARQAPTQQSLRRGTQTSGALFGGTDPVLARFAQALQRCAQRWLAGLPADPAHPLLQGRGGAPQFAGSWSVQLRSGGHHVNHIHHEGRLSSALHVLVPPAVAAGEVAGSQAGCLVLGEPPQHWGLDLPALRVLRPRAGHLALFPSYLWHGTRPFEDEAPRLSIAFDLQLQQA